MSPAVVSTTSLSAQIAAAVTPPPAPYTFPQATQIYQGIYSDGTRNLQIGTEYPEVQDILEYVLEESKLPDVQNNLLLALAATAVWNRPSHPAHWIFWGTEEKIVQTRALVVSIGSIKPLVVYHRHIMTDADFATIKPVFHASGWLDVLKDDEKYPWARELVPRPPAAEPRNLRSKRKAARYADDPLEGVELESPWRKKARAAARKSRPHRATPRTPPTAAADAEQSSDPASRAPPADADEPRASSSQSTPRSPPSEPLMTRGRRRAKADADLLAATSSSSPAPTPKGKGRALSSELCPSSDSTLAADSRGHSRASDSDATVVGESSEKAKGEVKEKAGSVRESEEHTTRTAGQGTGTRKRRHEESPKTPTRASTRASSKASDLHSAEDEVVTRASKRRRTAAVH